MSSSVNRASIAYDKLNSMKSLQDLQDKMTDPYCSPATKALITESNWSFRQHNSISMHIILASASLMCRFLAIAFSNSMKVQYFQRNLNTDNQVMTVSPPSLEIETLVGGTENSGLRVCRHQDTVWEMTPICTIAFLHQTSEVPVYVGRLGIVLRL